MKKMDKCKGLLSVLGPWCQFIEFHGDFSLSLEEDVSPNASFLSWTVMNNLFYLTVTFGESHPAEIEKIWRNVASALDEKQGANKSLVDIFVLLMLKSAKSNLITFVRSVFIYICRHGNGSLLLQSIVLHLTPKSMEVVNPTLLEAIFSTKCVPAKGHFLATMEDMDFSTNTKSYSVANLCTEFLMDVILEVDCGSIVRNLPRLLTFIFVLMDSGHYECENMRFLLVAIIQSLFANKSENRKKVDVIVGALQARVLTVN